MAYTLFVIEILSAFILAATLLYRYGDVYRNHIIVTVAVLTAWYFSFVIMFILPLDVSSTVYRQCMQDNSTTATVTPTPSLHNETSTPAPVPKCLKPWSFVDNTVFPNLWRVVYWTSQCLTWLIMPMMQSYSKAGDFTVKGKLKSALVDNAIYYGSYLFICGILLIYIALKPGVYLDWAKIKAIASSASNTWGLFLLILLLGYALVEVPRNLWNNSKKNYTLTYTYFKIAKLSTDKCEAEETMDEILDSLCAITAAVGPGHPLHRHVETIVQKLPIQLRDRLNNRQAPERPNAPSFKSLVNLHKKMIKALHVLQRTETQWGIMLERVFHLEDVSSNLRSPDRRFQHTFHTARPRAMRILYPPTVEWYWECFLKQYFLKTMAVVTGLMSVALVWSEMTFFCKQPVLSIFANILNAAKYTYNYAAIVWVSTLVIAYMFYCAYSTVLKIRLLNLWYLAPHHQTNEYSLIFSGMMVCRLTPAMCLNFLSLWVSTLVIAYMFYCAYSTVLKIRLLNLWYLAPHHQTNEYSLIFSGMMVCRLTPAMCLNFLSLVHMDSHVIKEYVLETYYTQIMGHMDVLGIVAEGFNIYFPMLVVLLCAATYLSLGSRLLSLCGFQQFVGDDDLTTDLVDEGREIVKREKRKRQRAEESLTRRRDFSERYANYRTNRDNQDGARTGLLHDVDSDYYVQPSPERSQPVSTYQRAELPYNRPTLEDELDQRFGESTLPTIQSEFDERRRDRMSAPPRGLFDDV